MGPVYSREPVFEVAEETFVTPFRVGTPVGVMTIQPMVIRCKEPVIVDTGVKWIREAWLETVFGLVEPADVRWIFVSHDDGEHAGNLAPLLERCPKARVVTNFVGFGRLGDELEISLRRVFFANHGDSFDAGDRKLTCLRPPLFDSPATRGLHDAKTGIYYSVDAFGALLPRYYQDADDVPPADYADGFAYWNRFIHPWHQVADPARIDESLNRAIRALDPSAIVPYHGPILRGRIDEAFERLLQVVAMGPLPEMTQQDLEGLLRGRPYRRPAAGV